MDAKEVVTDLKLSLVAPKLSDIHEALPEIAKAKLEEPIDVPKEPTLELKQLPESLKY